MEEMVRMLTELPPNETAAPFAMAIRSIKRSESSMAERFVSIAEEFDAEDPLKADYVKRVRSLMSVPEEEVIEDEDAKLLLKLFRYIALFLDIIIS
jgi:hypothetical protein